MDANYNVKVKIQLEDDTKTAPNCFVTMDFKYLATGAANGVPYAILDDMESEGEAETTVGETPQYSEDGKTITETMTISSKCKGYFTWNKENMVIKKGTVDKTEEEAA